MYPTLVSFTLFGIDFDFHAYTVTLAAAFLIGALCSVRRNYQLANPHPVTPIGGIWVFVGAIVGSKVYWILQYGEWSDLYKAFFLWQGGLVFYGGLIGGTLGGIAYVLVQRAPILPMGDIVFSYLPLAHGTARIGCFLNGCCWGLPWAAGPWAVAYPAGSQPYLQQLRDGLIDAGAAHAVPVHPTQLYSTVGLFAIFFIQQYLYRRHRYAGSIMLSYAVLYGALRFGVEIFRGDVPRSLLDMTLSQMIALGLFVFGVTGFAVLKSTFWREPLFRGPGPAFASEETTDNTTTKSASEDPPESPEPDTNPENEPT